MSGVRLQTFGSEQLPIVEPWFEDVDTQRWLGGPGWPSLILDRASIPLGEFRGVVEAGCYVWLAWDGDGPIGFIDCGTTDRWTTWEGGRNGRGVIATVLLPSANISYLVDPAVRRRGYGTAIVRSFWPFRNWPTPSCSPQASSLAMRPPFDALALLDLSHLALSRIGRASSIASRSHWSECTTTARAVGVAHEETDAST